MTKTILVTVSILIVLAILFAWDKPTTHRAYVPMITNSGTLNFPSTLAGASSDLTITVTGAVTNDVVMLGVPNGAVPVTGCFSAWVSATNTVTVRYTNTDPLGANDPSSGSFKVTVVKQ